MKKLIIAICAILVFGVYFLYPNKKTKAPVHAQAIKVETAKVEQTKLANKVEALGSLASLDSVDISPEIAGQIEEVLFKSGTYVKKGTPLIKLDTGIIAGELKSAQSSLKLSKINYERTLALSHKKMATQLELYSALATLNGNQDLVNAKQSQLEKTTLLAPFSGTLGAKEISVGQYVTIGQPLVHLVANQKLRVKYTVAEHYLSALRLGQNVEVVADSIPNKKFVGKVEFISPTIDEETRSIAVEAIIDNKDKTLSPGLFVKVTQSLGKPHTVLLIPEESVIATIAGQKVFIAEKGKACQRDISVGSHFEGKVEVINGLKANQTVIHRGHHKLKDGVTIEVIA